MTRFFQTMLGLLVIALAACSTPDASRGINDPNEATNRKIHAFNKKVDRTLLRPTSNAYGKTLPDPVRKGVGNFASNISTPGYFVNDVLQGNIHDATSNFLRFSVNTIFGFGGVLDVAGDMGIPKRDSDFGETMHVWGVGEGAYVELPFLGPSTQRDAVGTVVDVFTNPAGYAISTPERYAMPLAQGLAGVDARFEYGELVDSILYDSADSYAQARLLYLERRRFKLSGGAAKEEEFDPDANPFADYE